MSMSLLTLFKGTWYDTKGWTRDVGPIAIVSQDLVLLRT